MRHVSGKPFALERAIQAILLKSRSVSAIAAVGLCRDQAADAGSRFRLQRIAKVPVKRRDRADRIVNQIEVMDVEDRLGETLLLCRGNHQLSRGEPAVAVLTADLGLVGTAR